MNSLTYLLQVTACTAVFYLFYYLCLNRLTFFTTNRWYLLATVVLSFAIPLMKITVSEPHVYTGVVEQAVNIYVPQNTPQQTMPLVQTASESEPIQWGLIIKLAYMAAVLGLFIHLIVTLIAFFKRLRGKRVTKLGNVNILSSNEKITNGSFLNYIFLNDEELNSDEIQQIIAHEMLHVKLYHSADRIIVKIAQIILWFNPFIYLYSKSIEENHEFEVDRAMALNNDKHNYANLLVHLSVAGNGMLYHNFSKVPLKKRIKMLFNQPSNHMKKIIYLLVVPVVLISCLAFAKIKSKAKIQNALSAKTEAASLYSRVQIKNANKDSVWMEFMATDESFKGSASGSLTHNTKLGFIINKKFYTEPTFNALSAETKKTIRERASGWGCYDKADLAGGGLDQAKNDFNLVGYGAVFIIELNDADLTPELRTAGFISDLYTRTALKNSKGVTYDKVKIINSAGAYAETAVPHNAKVGIFVNHVLYTEEGFKNLPEATKIDLYKTATSLYVWPEKWFTFLRKYVGSKSDFKGYAAILTIVNESIEQYKKVAIDTPKYRQKVKLTPQQKIANEKQTAYMQTDDFKAKQRLMTEISAAGEISVKITDEKTKKGPLFTWNGKKYQLLTFYGQGKILNDLLKADDEVKLKIFCGAFRKEEELVTVEPAYIIKHDKKIYQMAEAGKIPEYPFLYEANKVRFTEGQISNIVKYANGKWKTALFETVNGYKFNLNFKPTAPDLSSIVDGDHVRLRFVNEIKTGAKSYRINNWVSISTDIKDYGIKNPEVFPKFYESVKATKANLQGKISSPLLKSPSVMANIGARSNLAEQVKKWELEDKKMVKPKELRDKNDTNSSYQPIKEADVTVLADTVVKKYKVDVRNIPNFNNPNVIKPVDKKNTPYQPIGKADISGLADTVVKKLIKKWNAEDANKPAIVKPKIDIQFKGKLTPYTTDTVKKS